MKKLLALLLCLTVVLSFSSVAFAKEVTLENDYPDFFSQLAYVHDGQGNYRFSISALLEGCNEAGIQYFEDFLAKYTDSSYTSIVYFKHSGSSYSISFYTYDNVPTISYVSSSYRVVGSFKGITLLYKSNSGSYDGAFSSSSGSYETFSYGSIFVNNNPGNVDFSNFKVLTDVSSITFGDTVSFHTLTVNYKYPDGTKAAESVTQELEAGAEYSIESPAVPGYLPDIETVTGTMPDEDLTVDVTYTKRLYQLTVKYQFEDGTPAFEDAVSSYFTGWTYSVESPPLEGYLPDKGLVSGTMPAQDVIEIVTYREVVIPQYTLTISYQYEDGSQALENVQRQYKEGETYSIPTPEIDGYKADKAAVTGIMPGSDTIITVVYKKDSTVQPGPGPGGPGEGGNPWENIGSGPKYDPFHNPFSPDNKGSSGSNPYLGLLNGIMGFKDPFTSVQVPEYSGKDPFVTPDKPSYSGYDPFHDAFSSNNVDGSGSNPFSGLWEMISGFSDPITGR